MEALQLKPEEAARLEAHLKSASKKSNNYKNTIPFSRKKKALTLYIETRSKSYVCSKHHMGRRTLNKILAAAGVE